MNLFAVICRVKRMGISNILRLALEMPGDFGGSKSGAVETVS